MKKYTTFIIYIIVALSSSAIDIILFNVFKKILTNILISTIIARVFSSIYNYILNKDKVFKNKGNVKKTLLYYYILVFVTMLSSGILVTIFDKIVFFIPTTIIKIIVDGILFIINYFIQKTIIFKTSN